MSTELLTSEGRLRERVGQRGLSKQPPWRWSLWGEGLATPHVHTHSRALTESTQPQKCSALLTSPGS